MKHPIREIVERHKLGMPAGIYSVCSAHPFVIEAAVLQAKKDGSMLLVEATSNQVDQYGGYTGMRPKDFAEFVRRIAIRHGLPPDRLILGGDHLGPNVWRALVPDTAMDKAKEQIAAYVKAGFTKIHLDASMPLKGDTPNADGLLAADIVAQRSAELCAVAESAWEEANGDYGKPVYVIGTDVPIPGGATESLENIRVTPVNEVRETLQATQDAFFRKNLQDAWQRTIAMVVQPGVEFGDQQIAEYDPDKAQELKYFIEKEPQFVYEAHSTDYQTEAALKQMVKDHFAILKVGPALTFAFREAIFALSFIEEELAQIHHSLIKSDIRLVLEQSMMENPKYWQNHYNGNHAQQTFARKYSFSDRARYYWPQKNVQAALGTLVNNLKEFVPPLTLLSQFLPDQYQAIRNRLIENRPEMIIFHKIQQVLKQYASATGLLVEEELRQAVKEWV